MLNSIAHNSRHIFRLLLPIILLLGASPVFAGDVTLTWTPPTTNVDGSPLTDLAGFKIYYGTSSSSYTQTINLADPAATGYTVTNLTDGGTYFFAVTAYDTSGNESDYSNEASKTASGSGGDTTPPVISGIYMNNITTTGATVNWTTDEASDTQVEYGTTTSYGSATTLDTSTVTNHSQTLSGLSPSTLYHYRVLSRDTSGNLATSGDYTFTTADLPDTTAPVISNVQISGITDTSATITWTTDEPSTSQVEYGLTTGYGYLTGVDSTLTTSHSVALSGLAAYTTYNFRVISEDASNNSASSGNYTFATSNTTPAIPSFTATPVSGYAPQMVDFAASASDSDGYITSYEWDYDGDGVYDGNTGSTPGATYNYTTPGTYNAKVRVTDDGGASTVSNAVTVTILSATNELPSINSFSAAPTTGATPLPVTFYATASDTDGTIVKYEWDFDGNGAYDVETTTSPASHTYNTYGSYTARVKVTDDGGASITSEIAITVSKGSDGSGSLSQGSQSSSGNGGSDGGSCFIATAAYGSYLDPHVEVLRDFRDKYLLSNRAGRVFVDFYYRNSPAAADYIARHRTLKVTVRFFLTPVVYGVKYPMAAMITILLAGIAAAHIIRKRAAEIK